MEPLVSYPGALSRVKTFNDDIYVADRFGKILKLNEDNTFTTILDITDRVQVDFIAGLLNFEFPPWYVLQPSIYVWYSAPGPNPGETISKVSVFPISGGLADPSKEVELVSVWNPTGLHVGGALKFLSDTTLMIGFGEGGGAVPLNTSQQDDTFLGKLVRYRINFFFINFNGHTNTNLVLFAPFNNPNFGNPIYAKGLRMPYEITEIDAISLTPEVIVYQNGGNSWETITHVTPGDNLGWPCYEGVEKRDLECNFPLKNMRAPFLLYPHNDPTSPGRDDDWNKVGTSISPGMIYKGSLFPEWKDAIVFGDLINELFIAKSDYKYQYDGRYMMDFLPVEGGVDPSESVILVSEDTEKEILVVGYNMVTFSSSTIYRVVRI